MKTVYKYKLLAQDSQIVEIPRNGKILSVKEQYNEVVIYALVDSEVIPKDKYSIKVVGTGHIADGVEEYEFLDSVLMDKGQLVFHVFYKLMPY